MSWQNTAKGRRWKGDDGKLYASAVAELQAKQKAPGSTYFEQLTGTRFVEPLARVFDTSKIANAIGSGLNQLARSAQAAIDPAEAYRQNWERQNQINLEQKALLSRVGSPNTVVTGLNERGEIDLTKSDEYKRFAFTPEGQFERYFKTPEFDYVFGAQTSKEPKTAAEMAALAAQSKAPTTSSLSDYYRSQSAMGRVNQAEIQKMYPNRPDLQKWAAENPMLAQLEYTKQMGRREAAGQVTPGVTYAGAPAQPLGDESFSVAANSVPAPWNTQGNKVSGEFAEVMPFQIAKTTGEGMPSLPTTLNQRAEELISTFKRDRGMF